MKVDELIDATGSWDEENFWSVDVENILSISLSQNGTNVFEV
jgi:hypothetical protein